MVGRKLQISESLEREVKEHLSNELLKVLREAVSPPLEAESDELQPRRKDMAGMSSCLNRCATTALRKNRKAHGSEGQAELLDLDLKANPFDEVTSDSILAGSTGNARLQHSHGISAKCMCGALKDDQAHISHNCPNVDAFRKPYREGIKAVVQEGTYTRHGLETWSRTQLSASAA